MKLLFSIFSLLLVCQASLGQKLIPYQDENGYFGFKDETNGIKIPAQFNAVKDFSEGLAAAALESNEGTFYGYINQQGNWVIPAKYIDANSFGQGVAAVYLNDEWTFIDHHGNNTFPLVFESADQFNQGGCWVNYKGYEQYLSRTGKLYNEALNDPELMAQKGVSIVIQNQLYGLIDSIGKELVAPTYDDLVWSALDKKFLVAFGDRDAFLTDQFSIEPRIYPFSKKEKYGFSDFYGNQIIEPIYDSADETDYNFHIVKRKKKYGLLDVTGKEIIPCEYDQIDYFYEGYSTALKDGVEYQIDPKGNILKK